MGRLGEWSDSNVDASLIDGEVEGRLGGRVLDFHRGFSKAAWGALESELAIRGIHVSPGNSPVSVPLLGSALGP